ncbi:ABC transporter permease [Afifella sp. IM 167]|uniref:ABC transporter permease n=1 Tax=Afifella sp. IM 167 TaxID=2033586 RepID=UPI001CCC7811|nr:ABC transporter permease [Afifella sp. IM 167]MBZ8135310.1 ABC transporter permease [Afifella sp. IM 167]
MSHNEKGFVLGIFGLRLLLVVALLLAWEGLARATGVPRYILPAPSALLSAFMAMPGYFLSEAGVTLAEILVGLLVGAAFGAATAILVVASPALERLAMPLLAASQALPVFAIAPLLVIWFGFGMASKIVMAGLIIYFPVATAFADGLKRTDPGLLDLARLNRASRTATFRLIRIPAALPSLASGLRVAASIAPIGAVVGEWVGASAGLGFIMLQANARMQTDRVFVALFLLAAMAIGLRWAVDLVLKRLLAWVPGEAS